MSTTQNMHWQAGNQLPVSGLFVPTPVLGAPPLAIDLPLQFANATRIRITVDVTAEQLADPLSTDGILYCCGTTTGQDFTTGYQFDAARMVPDIIGVGFSVEEVVNLTFPYLYITSRNTRACEVRIRAI